MLLGHALAVITDRQWEKMVLDIRVANARAAADKAAAFEVIGRAQTVAAQQPARADQALGQPAHVRIKRNRLRAGHLEVEFEMILKIATHAGPIGDDVDALSSQFRRWANARELEQLRRIDRSARKDDFAICGDLQDLTPALVLYADRAPALEQHTRRQRVRDNLDVGTLHRGMQIRLGSAAPRAIAHGHVHAAEAFLPLAVHVPCQFVPSLLRSIEPSLVERVAQRPVSRIKRPIRAAIRVAALGPPFGALEIGQHVGIAPARGAFIAPTLEIERIAAHIDQPVDRGRSTQPATTRRADLPAAQMRFGLAFIAPVVLPRVHRDRQRARHLDENRTIRAAMFKHQHTVPGRAQPICQHAPRRSRADYDVFECLSGAHGSAPYRALRYPSSRAARSSTNPSHGAKLRQTSTSNTS